MTKNAKDILEELLKLPNDELQKKFDAHIETGIGGLVIEHSSFLAEVESHAKTKEKLEIAVAALERIAWSNGNLNWLNDAAKEALEKLK